VYNVEKPKVFIHIPGNVAPESKVKTSAVSLNKYNKEAYSA